MSRPRPALLASAVALAAVLVSPARAQHALEVTDTEQRVRMPGRAALAPPAAPGGEGPVLKALRFGGDLIIRPDDPNFLGPSLTGDYRGKLPTSFPSSIDVSLKLQQAPGGADSDELADSVLLTGGSGSAAVYYRAAHVGKDWGFSVVVKPIAFGWSAVQVTDSASTSPTQKFGTYDPAGTASVWYGPVYVGAELGRHWYLGDVNTRLADQLDATNTLKILAVIAVEQYYLQALILPSSGVFELRVGGTWEPL